MSMIRGKQRSRLGSLNGIDFANGPDKAQPSECPKCGSPLRGRGNSRCYACHPGGGGKRKAGAKAKDASVRAFDVSATQIRDAAGAVRGPGPVPSPAPNWQDGVEADAAWSVLRILTALGRDAAERVLQRVSRVIER